MASGILPANATFPWGLAVIAPISVVASVVVDPVWWQTFLALLEILVPVALLCSLFCARLGVERGRALAGGILPGWLFFCVLLFAVGESGGLARQVAATAPAMGLILLATFTVIRADPPAPASAGWGWTLVAGALGALSICGRAYPLTSVNGLGLYIWWSAGWRRALGFALGEIVIVGAVLTRTARWHEPVGRGTALSNAIMLLTAALLAGGLRRWMPPGTPPTVETETPGALPMGSAHRMIGVLLFLTLMALVASATGEAPMVYQWEFIVCPLGLAASLGLTSLLARAIPPRTQEG